MMAASFPGGGKEKVGNKDSPSTNGPVSQSVESSTSRAATRGSSRRGKNDTDKDAPTAGQTSSRMCSPKSKTPPRTPRKAGAGGFQKKLKMAPGILYNNEQGLNRGYMLALVAFIYLILMHGRVKQAVLDTWQLVNFVVQQACYFIVELWRLPFLIIGGWTMGFEAEQLDDLADRSGNVLFVASTVMLICYGIYRGWKASYIAARREKDHRNASVDMK